jgi:hypothetical protein
MDAGVVWCLPALFWIQMFVFANHFPFMTSDDAAMWTAYCEIKKKRICICSRTVLLFAVNATPF